MIDNIIVVSIPRLYENKGCQIIQVLQEISYNLKLNIIARHSTNKERR